MKKNQWSDEEKKIISDKYGNMGMTELMALLPDRSINSIYNRAFLLGVKRSEEYLSENCRFRNGHKTGLCQFEKGHTPWNKGKKVYLGGEAGYFKKGHTPHNTKQEGDGAISVRNTKGRPYKHVRVALGKWRQLHTHTWEQANGHIPEGHIVVFKDGDTMNCAIENLELISLEENMRRNSRHRYPEEINELIQIKLVFTRKLNKIKKKYGKS